MKKARLINTAILLTAAATTPGTVHGATAHLQVGGTIRPAACIPTLQGGGAITYPDVSYRSLSQTGVTKLATREIQLTITCDAAAKVGIRTVDNRSASKLVSNNIVDAYAWYGMGTAGTVNIGAYHIAIKKLQAGSVSLEMLVRGPQTASLWAKSSAGEVRSDQTVSWGAVNSVVVSSYQSITATLEVAPMLNQASLLPANEVIKLDGSTTIEMVYL